MTQTHDYIEKKADKKGDNIVLIGMMGCGKSTVGKALARALSYTFVDMDEAIEAQEGMSIPEIFEMKGETYFRQCESAFLKNNHGQGIVLSTGGGIVKKSDHKALLQAIGRVIYLQGTHETLSDHLSGESENRPVLKKQGIGELLAERHPLYNAFSNDIIIIDDKDIETIVAEIMMK